MSDRFQRAEMERAEDWRNWVDKVPSIKFPRSWSIQIIPPFAGALIRFQVNNCISVYLDVDNALGFFTDDDGKPAPYWEAYSIKGDTERFSMNNTAGLIKAISQELRRRKST